MRIPKERFQKRRLSLFMVATAMLTGLFVWHGFWNDTVGPIRFVCDQENLRQHPPAPTLPDTQYLISSQYGWFDQSHFNTGKPARIIEAVQAAVAGGADTFVIRQGVRDNVTGYSAVYWVAPEVEEADVLSIALGIYYDWSIRFETWESQMPRLVGAPFSPFAVEDLPSQYIGFYAKSHNMTIEEVFACYLGPVLGSDDGPPELVFPHDTAAPTDEGIIRLENRTFTPMVETSAGWQHVSWPEPMRLHATSSSFSTWRYLSEDTWYLNDASADLHLLDSTLGDVRQPAVK